MPTPTKGPRLGGGPAHERLMLNNLAAALFTHKSIKTTETRAKRLRPVAERMITFAKRGDLHARRRVAGMISDKSVVHELFTEIAPQVADRQGGYTRITKLGFRKGDQASMVQIELVLEPVTPKVKSTKSKSAAAAKPVAAEPVADEPVDAAAAEPAETPVEVDDASVETEATETPVQDTVEIPESVSMQARSDAAEATTDNVKNHRTHGA